MKLNQNTIDDIGEQIDVICNDDNPTMYVLLLNLWNFFNLKFIYDYELITFILLKFITF